MSKARKKTENSELDDLNFLKAFTSINVSESLTLEDEERAANALLHASLAKAKRYQAEHNYNLPDHLEQFRREYEKADHKARGKIPLVSTLSPRTRRELSLLPPPNAFEEQKVKKFVEMSKKEDKTTLYDSLAHHAPLEDAPRLTSIINSHMVLIPHNASKEVGKASTHYFETMEHAKLRKQEQDAKLARLFDKYNDAATDEPTKGRARSSQGASAPRSPKSKSTRTLPKLTHPTGGAVPVPAASAAPSKPSADSSRGQKSTTGSKVGGFSLSRSLTSLGAISRSKSPDGSGAGARPSSMESSLSPKKSLLTASGGGSDHYAAAQQADAETLVAENTPLLYSMFQANPMAERGVRYSPTAMEQMLHERYQHESERLARITAKLKTKSEQEYLNLFSVKVLDEIGLDLNKEYNKIRNYTIYLMQLSYHFYMQRLRAGFSHFYAQYAKIREARLAHAKKVIYRSLKLGIYILTQNEKRRRRIEQERAEDLRQLELDAIFRKKCHTLYKALFYHKQIKKIRRLVRVRRAATRIQRRVRGMQGRRKAREWKALKALMTSSAIKIQCAYRQHLARRKVTLTRKLRNVYLLLEDLARFRATCLQQMRLDGAELYIAKAYRTLVLRRKLKNLLYWNRYRCAVLIQRIYLGYRVRKKFMKIWNLHKQRVARENACAWQIQMCIRRYLARKQLRERAQKKARLARERKARKLLILATSSQFTLKRALLHWFRKASPFRLKRLHKKATDIQRVWRGHHGRNRAFIVKVTKAIKKISDAYHRRERAAALIQRNVRGWMTRLKLLRAKKYRLAVRIQTLWRLVHAKRRVKQLKKRNADARNLTRKLHRLCKKHKFHLKYMWEQQRTPYVVRMQALMRGAVTRVRLARLRSAKRQAHETQLFITTRINQLLAATQLQLIRDTISVPIGHKSYTFSGENCSCLGPVQALFSLFACNKGRTDPVALVTNKADSITMIKLFNKVKGLMDKAEKSSDGHAGAGDESAPKAGKKKKPKKAHPIIDKLCLFLEFDAGRFPLPAVHRKLKPNHIDILFNRAKTETGNLLSYQDFTECLRLVAEAHYSKVEVKEPQETGEGGGAVNNNSAEAAPTTQSNEATHASAAGTHAHNHKLDHASHQFAQAGHKRRVHQLSLARLKCSPTELFAGSEPDYRMALVIHIFASLRGEEAFAPVLEWIHRESMARIEVFAVRIQAVARRHFAKKIVSVRAKLRDEQRLAQKLWSQATKVQSLARMFLHRFRLARRAQRTIIQYVPHFGEPYWYHPCTRVKSWSKPKVLRSLDAYSIALPEEGLENVVNCTYCNRPAEVNCCECEDSMCKVCYDSMHCKGGRIRHRPMRIPSCAYCKFQVATKSCLTCIITAPVRGNIRESVPEADRGFYCDTCFVHEHDSNEKALHIHKQRRKGLKNILSYSSQAYLIDQYLHQRIITSHHYEDLVQPCEECCTRSSTWRCQDCNQVYCSSCLVGLHSMGGPFARHRAEQLPYFTPEMHVSFKADINRQLFQQKMDKLVRVEKARREELHHRCATKVQAWWRMIIYGYRGRKEMRRRRRRLRIAYKAHKRDTIERRNTFGYRLRDFFGRAPPLISDTKEQAALRTLNAFQKQAAREFIYENQEDWGYYRVSRTQPRKGIPKKGFDWGTPEELTEQAINGGYRLPGRVMVVPGEQIFATTRDLTRIIRPGEYVRIRQRIFGVVRVTSTTIRVNRFWRAGLDEAKPSEEGELMFRAPMYKGEPRRGEFRRRYLAYYALVENPISQLGVGAYRFYTAQMMRFALYMVRSNRRNGMKEEEQAWRTAAAQYADNIRYADSLYATGDELKSLYGTVRMKIIPPPMREDALSRSMKKKSFKGNLAEMQQDEGFGDAGELDGLLDKDDSGSHDSWGEPAEVVRPKSALQRAGSVKKLNRVVPAGDVSGGAEATPSAGEGAELSAAPAEGESTKLGLPDQPDDTASMASDTSSRSKRSGLLTLISSKFTNQEEADAVRAAADAMHELEKADLPKAAGDVAAVLAEKKKAKEEKKKKKFEKPKEPWYATAEQLDARAEREDKMSLQELALEADDWKECIDIMTENIYYQNIKTNELFSTVPRAVAAKRQLEFENSKNKRNYDEAQKRIQKIEQMIRNRKLITGGTHK